MRFGQLHLFEHPSGRTEKQVTDEQFDIMVQAEDYGFDSVWPAEHHFHFAQAHQLRQIRSPARKLLDRQRPARAGKMREEIFLERQGVQLLARSNRPSGIEQATHDLVLGSLCD